MTGSGRRRLAGGPARRPVRRRRRRAGGRPRLRRGDGRPPAPWRPWPPGRCRCRTCWSTTRWPRSAGWPATRSTGWAGRDSSSAVTGSSGKTSTKDLLAAVLEPLGPTVAPAGSFNTEIGLPLTALRRRRGHQAPRRRDGRARGRPHRLPVRDRRRRGSGWCSTSAPRTPASSGRRRPSRRAKSELVRGAAGGRRRRRRRAQRRRPAGRGDGRASPTRRVVTVRARRRTPTCGPSDVGWTSWAAVLHAAAPGARAGPGRPALHGAHHVGNALAAAAVALELGLTAAEVAAALGRRDPASRWRMEVTERPDGVTVVNDAYNANPESMRAALAALVAMARGRRTWAVLGEMAELGAASAAEHEAGRQTGRASSGVDRLARRRVQGARGRCTAARAPRAPSRVRSIVRARRATPRSTLLRARAAPGRRRAREGVPRSRPGAWPSALADGRREVAPA